MGRQSSAKSVSSKSTISTAVSTTSYSTYGSTRKSNNLPHPSAAPGSLHKRGSVFGGPPSPRTSSDNYRSIAEDRSPTISSKGGNDVMARVVNDRTGAFPQMSVPIVAETSGPQHHQPTLGGQLGGESGPQFSGSNGVAGGPHGQMPLPPSPRRGYPQIPPSPASGKQAASLAPKLRTVPSSGASVGSNAGSTGGAIGIPRSNSRDVTYGSGGAVASGGNGRATPTRQHHHHQERKAVIEYDDAATHFSHHTHGSAPSGGVPGSGSSVAASVVSAASAGSGPRFAPSVVGSVSSHGNRNRGGSFGSNGLDTSIQDSVRQKGIAKRKRKEYSKDPRYVPVRRVVDELNKAIGPEKRRAAVERACREFDHSDEARHNAELYLGAANVLCLVLSMSDQEDETRAACAALEMVYRAEREAVIISYQDVGAALVPLLLRLLERFERGNHGRKAVAPAAEAAASSISRVLLHMTRISELRVPLAGHPGMLAALERASTSPLGAENRVLRMRLLANLANSEGNKAAIFGSVGLMEATMKVATLDKAEGAREYASAVLMDLSSCSANQVAMAGTDRVLATLVKLAVMEDRTETREYAVSGLQNLAFEKRNRTRLVSYGGGVVVEALKKCAGTGANDKTRRRAAGALTNLACDETAETMANHPGLLQALSRASMSDDNRDVQQRATLALTKLANSINVRMSCWGALLDALIVASRCSAADGIVSAMFRVKTRAEENRTSMTGHPRLLETLAQLCLRAKDHSRGGHEADSNGHDYDDAEWRAAYKDCENATKAIAHLANDPLNHKIICNKHILAALVHGASLAGPDGTVTRDAAILAMERMAMEHSNRPMMARYPGMLVSVARATEREMNEELNGMPASSVTGQPRLAKPLLMSLLVAM